MKEELYNKSRSFDVVIIGGGITGSAASVFLSGLGYKVALIEKSDLSNVKSGESLTPECRRFLNLMNFPVDVSAGIEYFGTASRWGGSSPATQDFIFGPYGNGISIDKNKFEQKLVKHAEREGAVVFMKTGIRQMTYADTRWEMTVRRESEVIPLQARLVIFATGRNSPVKQNGPKRLFHDKLIAHMAIDESDAYDQPEKTLYVESLPDGWFYTNTLPQNKRVFTFFTDSDLLPAARSKMNDFEYRLRKTSWFADFGMGAAERNVTSHAFDARTSWSNCQCGPGWLEIGDTAYTIDPLSGRGIQKNLEMVYFCVEHIRSFLDGDPAIREKFLAYNKNRFESYLVEGRSIFGHERRWAKNEFWSRRLKQITPDVVNVPTPGYIVLTG